jgi:UDP:flavonoid glycosyltransferase YjiC (YdhE family)
MARIMFAWELGGGLGHLSRARLLAHALRKRRHEPVFAFQDLSRAEAMFGRDGFACYQAPLWMPRLAGLPPAATFAELLFRFGYLDPDGLLGVVRAWRGLFDLLRPDLLIADHAPTALLSARGMPMRKAQFGNGFAVPPRLCPMPPFRTWEKIDARRIEQSENKALSSANHVLQRLDLPQLNAFMDLFEVDEDFLCIWPELDHYPQRPASHYWGPTMLLGGGAPPVWPMGDGKRIFAYLKGDFAYLEPVLQALDALPNPTLVYAAGISPALISRYQSANLAFASQPVGMDAARRQADLMVCHGGDATVSAALLAGKPLMVLPMHAEQYGMAKNVERLGAGLNVAPENYKPDYRKLFKRLLNEASFTRQAQAFAEKYSGFDSLVQIEQIADRCEQLLLGVDV